MILHMSPSVTETEIAAVCNAVRRLGGVPHLLRNPRITSIVFSHIGENDSYAIESMSGVVRAIRPATRFLLANRDANPEGTMIRIGRELIGGPMPVVIAGPCAVETLDQTREIATRLAGMGINILRGGAYKPRTSPYDFQGLGAAGLDILQRVRAETGMAIVTEAVGTDCFDDVERVADIIQIGARNMHNVELLRRAGRSPRPILLKRHYAATFDEFLLCAEYILLEGNHRVILCERGIRSFNDHSRFTLDLAIVPRLRERTHLPILVDPSHAAGDRRLVPPLARAALAAGADGIMVETHCNPDASRCDADQAIDMDTMQSLISEIGCGAIAAVSEGAVT